jgi:hypothetical protein
MLKQRHDGSASAGSISPMTWLGVLYFPFLVVHLLVPLMARWRWELVAALIATVVEVLVFYLLDAYRVFADPFAGEPAPQASIDIVTWWRERQAVAFFQLFAWAIIPALAALIGGALSVRWSSAVVVWRSYSEQRMRLQ